MDFIDPDFIPDSVEVNEVKEVVVTPWIVREGGGRREDIPAFLKP